MDRAAKPAPRQRRRDGGNARNDFHDDSGADGSPNQALSRVGQRRHACIGDKGNLAALLKLHQQFGRPPGFIELVVTNERLLETVAGEQDARVGGGTQADAGGIA